MPTPTVYLVRHATPDWSRTDLRYDIPPGPPLTAQGEDEARELGAFLRKAGVRKLYTSPLERTLRTAHLAADGLGVTPEVAEAIAEWQRGETDALVLARVRPFWEAACAESGEHGPVALITHGGPIRALLEDLGADGDELWHYRRQFDHQNPAPPAGVWLTAQPEGQPWTLNLVFAPQPFQVYAPTAVAPAAVAPPLDYV